jgi:putative cardiolipin synthase
VTGRYFANALLRAADRGVRVRVLIDDVGASANDETCSRWTPIPMSRSASSTRPPRGRSGSSVTLGDFTRLNRRMHNKAFVADNQAAILGGRNIADEYFDASTEVAFGDLDVLTYGPAVAAVSGCFRPFLERAALDPGRRAPAAPRARHPASTRSRAKLAVFVEEQRGTPYGLDAQTRFVQIVAAGTEGSHGVGRTCCSTTRQGNSRPVGRRGAPDSPIQRPRHADPAELLIVSPYFIPGEAGTAWLRALVKRGVRVTVLTNSLAASDVGLVHSAYSRYRNDCWKAA